jgi:putative ATP-dependent endonuclease of OLD family
MRVEKVHIRNFRLLEDVDISFDETTTLIVGRNNSGKTSLTELFRRLFSGGRPTFSLEDFSLGVHEQFWRAFKLKCAASEDNEIRSVLPMERCFLLSEPRLPPSTRMGKRWNGPKRWMAF